MPDTTTIGTLGILRPQVHETREPPHPGHGEIEQDEIDLPTPLEQCRHLVERGGLGDVDAIEQAGDGLAQRAAKKRVIIRDDQTCQLARPFHLRLPGSTHR